MTVIRRAKALIFSFVQSESGTSLLELMGAMAAGLVVLGATLQSLSFFQRQFSHQQEQIARQQDLRLGLELLEQELRLAGFASLTTAKSDEVEFTANIHGLETIVTESATMGQTTLAVDDARGWPERKITRVCWNDQCDQFTLARTGQRNLLTLTEPIPRMIPAGAAATVSNRVRYYTRPDDRGVPRLLRQIDGGASVLVGDLEAVRFSYWDERGHVAAEPGLVRRIVVEVWLPRFAARAIREISLRT
jgi:hypothetical protein